MIREHELLSIEEAAEYLGVKKSTMYSWVFYRKIPFVKVGRLVKFERIDLNKWIERRKIPDHS